jgi:hypothetical protein
MLQYLKTMLGITNIQIPSSPEFDYIEIDKESKECESNYEYPTPPSHLIEESEEESESNFFDYPTPPPLIEESEEEFNEIDKELKDCESNFFNCPTPPLIEQSEEEFNEICFLILSFLNEKETSSPLPPLIDLNSPYFTQKEISDFITKRLEEEELKLISKSYSSQTKSSTCLN